MASLAVFFHVERFDGDKLFRFRWAFDGLKKKAGEKEKKERKKERRKEISGKKTFFFMTWHYFLGKA